MYDLKYLARLCMFLLHEYSVCLSVCTSSLFPSSNIELFDGLDHVNHIFSEIVSHWQPVLPCSDQSRENPVSASAMLTGKFLQIQKVFATSSLLAEEFPDTLQYKISR